MNVNVDMNLLVEGRGGGNLSPSIIPHPLKCRRGGISPSAPLPPSLFMCVCMTYQIPPTPALPVSHLLREEEEEDSDDGGVTGGGASTSTELEFDLKTYLQK